MRDVGKAAKDWPQLNFLIYHSAYRWVGGNPAEAMTEFDRSGRSSWVSDLAEIPEKYGVSNVYGDLGQLFAWTAVAEPRLSAALMGLLIKGLGSDHVLWGTDAVWTGAPQWQIEGLRRLEIPEEWSVAVIALGAPVMCERQQNFADDIRGEMELDFPFTNETDKCRRLHLRCCDERRVAALQHLVAMLP